VQRCSLGSAGPAREQGCCFFSANGTSILLIGRISTITVEQGSTDNAKNNACQHVILPPVEEILAMWTTLTFIAALALAPADAGQLALTNVRSTYGILGAPRAEDKFLPGDMLVLCFDMEGVKVDDAGKVVYSIGMEVSDADGKVQFKQAPRQLEAITSLGGNTIPAFANIQIGLDQPPGRYSVKVTVTDVAAGATQELTRSYEVLPKGFGIVRVTTSSDPEGRVPASAFGVGQSLWINFAAVGSKRDEKGQPNLAVALRVLDDQGRPTLSRPFVGEINDKVPERALAVPLQFLLDLNRAGNFTIELKATDKSSNETASLSLPLTVVKTK
jgi:hypothetical protein